MPLTIAIQSASAGATVVYTRGSVTQQDHLRINWNPEQSCFVIARLIALWYLAQRVNWKNKVEIILWAPKKYRLATPYGDIDLGQQWLEGTGLSGGTKPLPESKLADRQCVLWYSHESNFSESTHGINLQGKIKHFVELPMNPQITQNRR